MKAQNACLDAVFHHFITVQYYKISSTVALAKKNNKNARNYAWIETKTNVLLLFIESYIHWNVPVLNGEQISPRHTRTHTHPNRIDNAKIGWICAHALLRIILNNMYLILFILIADFLQLLFFLLQFFPLLHAAHNMSSTFLLSFVNFAVRMFYIVS